MYLRMSLASPMSLLQLMAHYFWSKDLAKFRVGILGKGLLRSIFKQCAIQRKASEDMYSLGLQIVWRHFKHGLVLQEKLPFNIRENTFILGNLCIESNLATLGKTNSNRRWLPALSTCVISIFLGKDFIISFCHVNFSNSVQLETKKSENRAFCVLWLF